MGFFDEEILFIDSLQNVLEEAVKESFARYDFVVLDYLTNKQWFQKGEKADGKKIKPGYKRITIKIKQKKGDPYDRVTLRDTGKLYNSIDLIVGDRALIMRVNVDYYAKLEKRYGSKIAGIQQKFLEEFCENYIIPTINEKINDKLTAIR